MPAAGNYGRRRSRRDLVMTRTVFMGTPDFSVPSLRALLDHPAFDVVGVVTQPDRRAGRGRKLRCSPVKETALAADVPVLQPQRLREPEAFAQLAALEPELIVVAAYGQILRPNVLDLPRLAASTSMPRCCRAGGAHRPSMPLSWLAIPSPAAPSCAWTKAWTPALSWRRPPKPSAQTIQQAACMTSGATRRCNSSSQPALLSGRQINATPAG